VRTLGIRLIGTHLGREDRRQIENLWDAPCFDMYGTHESGMLGAVCQHQSNDLIKHASPFASRVDECWCGWLLTN